MENFKIWMLSLCGATAITSLFKILLSGSTLNKVLNIFFSVFILFYTVIPISSFLKNYSYETQSNETTFDYDDLYKKGYDEMIKASIKSICQKKEIEVIAFEISSYVNDEGYLCIEQLEIDINDNEMISVIESEIEKQLGYEVTVK